MTTPQPAESVLLAEWEAAEILWTEGANNDTYHETETLDDAWERLFRVGLGVEDPILMYLMCDANGKRVGITKYPNGRYVKLYEMKPSSGPDQIRRAKGQS